MTAVDTIIDHVAASYGVTAESLRSTRRHGDVVWARYVAIWLARELTPLSLPRIGQAFGGRDHSSIHHALRRMDSHREMEPSVKDETDALFLHLKGEIVEEEREGRTGGIQAVSLALWLIEKPASDRAASGAQIGILCEELLRLNDIVNATQSKENSNDGND